MAVISFLLLFRPSFYKCAADNNSQKEEEEDDEKVITFDNNPWIEYIYGMVFDLNNTIAYTCSLYTEIVTVRYNRVKQLYIMHITRSYTQLYPIFVVVVVFSFMYEKL